MMGIKEINMEVRLFVLLKQKEKYLNDEFGIFLQKYLNYYQKIINNLDSWEIEYLLNHFSNSDCKKYILSYLNVSEDKYYSDLRRITKKVGAISYGKY